MAGLYLHIPFCKRKCHYCNFYSQANVQHKPQLVEMLLKEIALQKDYLNGEELESIYFGGGTPSLLTEKEIHALFEQIHRVFPVTKTAEITFEANPDDLNLSYLQMLKQSPVNRLSIGIQSFHDNELHYLNRLHTGKDAMNILKRAHDVGFSSMSIDLIYGIPISSTDSWLKNLALFRSLQIDHLSAYSLTREENTAYDLLIKKGKYAAPSDVQSEEQFKLLLEFAKQNSLEQYEISNFAFHQKYAIHNTNYWMRKKYLGIGPSAHSFNSHSRSWNVSHINTYIEQLSVGNIPSETETLSLRDQWNESIMTGLRTKWGVDIQYLKQTFDFLWVQEFELMAKKYINSGQMLESNDRY
ncbi:MAG TPA: coproporphyrinogen III oxidase, partial [Bacteroidales bacterium]|nr:coproporphyrinogen III oxidase [Bacteroidales bacterium]